MPPQDFRCSAQSSQSLRVRWDPPPTEYRNGIIEGYKVFYKNVNMRLGTQAIINIKNIYKALTFKINSKFK